MVGSNSPAILTLTGNNVSDGGPNPIRLIDSIVEKWSLNTEQEQAFRIIATHASRSKMTMNEPKLRMYLGGPGGTGKSTVISAVKEYFEQMHEERRFRLASFTGIAAKNISGQTLHALLRLLQAGQAAKRGSKTNQELIAMWRGVDYLLIDEVSMIGCGLLAKINMALELAKESKSPFGGINIIFCGDFAQLPSVLDPHLYSPLDTTSNKSKPDLILGKVLWLLVDTVIFLHQPMRQSGPENARFVELLTRLRDGQCTVEDHELLTTRLIQNNADTLTDPAWHFPMTLVYDNATKDALNVIAVQAFARATGRALHWYYSCDKHRKEDIKHEELLTHLRQLPTSATEQRLGRIPLVLGMKVIVSQNFDVTAGIVNGSMGVLKRIRYRMNDRGERVLTSCVVSLQDEEPAIPGMAANDAPILADTKSFTLKHPFSPRKCTIQRTQVPVQPAYAITAHRAQGQTYSQVVIDLQNTKSVEAAYVMVSRATSLQSLLILRPFELRRIRKRQQTTPLKREMRRLQVLALQTRLPLALPGTEAYNDIKSSLLEMREPLKRRDRIWSDDPLELTHVVQVHQGESSTETTTISRTRKRPAAHATDANLPQRKRVRRT